MDATVHDKSSKTCPQTVKKCFSFREAITVKPPTSGPERQELPISGWCIRCWEVREDSSEGLEWILFTAVAVTDAAVAKEQLDWY
ncbi:hypothetical protein [Microcoleus sp. F4-D5]|uniref:hypothetical protein n=1 Tax=Microcoleus sp. F4-D5 TaxID=2818760 RepID=UPI002FD5608C